jgi:hypothetical protein
MFAVYFGRWKDPFEVHRLTINHLSERFFSKAYTKGDEKNRLGKIEGRCISD